MCTLFRINLQATAATEEHVTAHASRTTMQQNQQPSTHTATKQQQLLHNNMTKQQQQNLTKTNNLEPTKHEHIY